MEDKAALDDGDIDIDMSGMEGAIEDDASTDPLDISDIALVDVGISAEGQLRSPQDWALAGEARAASPSATKSRRRITILVAWR